MKQAWEAEWKKAFGCFPLVLILIHLKIMTDPVVSQSPMLVQPRKSTEVDESCVI